VRKQAIDKRSDAAVDARLSLDHLVLPFDKSLNQKSRQSWSRRFWEGLMSISRRQFISVAGARIARLAAPERCLSQGSAPFSRGYPPVKNLER
jgi:hypothetical protein